MISSEICFLGQKSQSQYSEILAKIFCRFSSPDYYKLDDLPHARLLCDRFTRLFLKASFNANVNLDRSSKFLAGIELVRQLEAEAGIVKPPLSDHELIGNPAVLEAFHFIREIHQDRYPELRRA